MTLEIRYLPQLQKYVALYSTELGVWQVRLYDGQPSPWVAMQDFLEPPTDTPRR